MNPELVTYLQCPICQHSLDLQATEQRDTTIWHGQLKCSQGHTWPINEGIVCLRARSANYNGAQLVNRLKLAAWGYERLWRPYALSLMSGSNFPLAEECALMIEQIAPKRGGLYLDLACSNGLYSRALAQESTAKQLIIGLDHSLPMLKEAQQRAQQHGLNITFIQGLAEYLPFKPGIFNGIACGGSFNEFTQPDRVLSEVRRCLNPSGRSWWMFARQADSRTGKALQFGLQSGGISFPSETAMIKALTSAGLSIHWTKQAGAVQMIATRGQIIHSDLTRFIA